MRLHIPPAAPSESAEPPIGVFDSGIGGLAVVREILRQAEAPPPLVYLADQAHAPFGTRPVEEVEAISSAIAAALLRLPCGIVVLACNTASAAALYPLREQWPESLFVGMEPAVKPAAARSRNGRIGVIATANTLRGQPYAGVVARFAADRAVHTLACPEFVELVETGETDSARARIMVEKKLYPLLSHGIDQLVLGCTHYSFLKPLIETACRGRAQVIDPVEAVARQTLRVWRQQNQPAAAPGAIRFLTTAPERQAALAAAIGRFLPARPRVEIAVWQS